MGSWTHTSPNLLVVHDALVAGGFVSMGRNGYNVRPIRGGTAWSTHAFGAAIDIRWPNRDTADWAADWLIAWSEELGIQRIHDYGAGRYWQAGRGWIMRAPGTGDPTSFHLETTPDAWSRATKLADRAVPAFGASAPTTPPKYPGKPLQRGSTGVNVKRVQERLGGLEVDGKYGPRTEAAVIAYQTAHQLKPDGIVGPVTWRHLFAPNA